MPKKEKRHHTHPKTLNNAKSLRQDPTPSEYKLWYLLRNNNLIGFKFRRQHPIGKYIVDFYCAKAKLIVELDGDSHFGKETYDQIRTDWLEDQGYKVIRFTDTDVHENIDGVTSAILEECERRSSK